jgi:CheY-like chemotaxis protein
MSHSARVRPVHLLIIEDNPGDVRLLEEAFDELRANVRIEVAKDGAEGIAVVARGDQHKENSPDLILLDLNLPKVSGHDVLKRIKSDPRTRHIPVIILTSSRAEADVHRAYESHANAYLRKPSTLEGLLNTARDVKNFWMETAILPR